MAARTLDPPPSDRRQRHVDVGLTTLMLLQGFTLFVAIPLGGGAPGGRALLDACHLAFAVICIGVLTRHRGLQAALLAIVALLVAGPALAAHLGSDLNVGPTAQHGTIAAIAFSFNATVTALVARHVFGPGPVTVHRVRGAILLYLNVAALFAIADGAIAMNVAGAYAAAGGAGAVGRRLGRRRSPISPSPPSRPPATATSSPSTRWRAASPTWRRCSASCSRPPCSPASSRSTSRVSAAPGPLRRRRLTSRLRIKPVVDRPIRAMGHRRLRPSPRW